MLQISNGGEDEYLHSGSVDGIFGKCGKTFTEPLFGPVARSYEQSKPGMAQLMAQPHIHAAILHQQRLRQEQQTGAETKRDDQMTCVPASHMAGSEIQAPAESSRWCNHLYLPLQIGITRLQTIAGGMIKIIIR